MNYVVVLDNNEEINVRADFMNAQPTGDWVFSNKQSVQPSTMKPGEFLTEPVFIARAFRYIKVVGDSLPYI